MGRKVEKLYTTGKVAKLFDIKKDTLFYYDKINLFSPNYRKGNTNYRYYGNDQLALLDTILVLREMDISISELKSYLNNMNTESFLHLMELESKKIEAKITDLKTKKKVIHEMGIKMKTALSANYEQLIITEQKENVYYISTPLIKGGKNEDEDWHISQENLLTSYQASKIITFGSILPLENLQNYDYSNLSYVTAFTIDKTNQYQEKGLYAQMYFKGDYDSLTAKYNLFHSMINNADYIIVSDIYEEYIISSLSEKSEDKFITLLSAKIIKN